MTAVATKQIILRIRYPFDTISQLLWISLLFLMIFIGGSAAAGPEFGDSLEAIVVGFFLMTMSVNAYGSLANNVMEEAKWGTLEQLYLSAYGFNTFMFAKVVVNLLESFLKGVVVLAFMMAVTGIVLAIDVVSVVTIAVLSLLSVVGIGFALAGLALLYKRISSFLPIVQFVVLGLIAAPVTGQDIVYVLPLALGSSMLQRAMRQGMGIWEFPLHELVALVVNGGGYFLIGFAIFYLAQLKTKERGTFGQY